MDQVLRVMAEIGRDAWTVEIVDRLRERADKFYPAVHQALLKLERNGEVRRVPHPDTGLRGPILWRMVAELDLDEVV
jgi:hypothetical protein